MDRRRRQGGRWTDTYFGFFVGGLVVLDHFLRQGLWSFGHVGQTGGFLQGIDDGKRIHGG